jgi:hypothetical protein
VIIVSNRHLNLHVGVEDKGAGPDYKLVHVDAGRPCRVPDSVANHPQFKMLKRGTITVLSKPGNPNEASVIAALKAASTRSKAKEADSEDEGDDEVDNPGPVQNPEAKSVIPQAEGIDEIENEGNEGEGEDEEKDK